jgi:hypothetical protein
MQNTLKTCQLKINNMSALTTDGGRGATLSGNIEHQENMCAKSFPGFQHVMSVTIKVVYFIWSKGLNHRQLQNLLSESEALIVVIWSIILKFSG